MQPVFDVVENSSSMQGELARPFSESGESRLRLGTQVLVPEGQSALLVCGDEVMDVFGPGSYSLAVAGGLLVEDRLGAAFSSGEPFAAEVYFVNTAQVELKWGTRQPLAVAYPGPALDDSQARAFGKCTMQITDPWRFVEQVVVVGRARQFKDIQACVRDVVAQALGEVLGELHEPGLALEAWIEAAAAGTRARLPARLEALGAVFQDLRVEAISPAGTRQGSRYTR